MTEEQARAEWNRRSPTQGSMETVADLRKLDAVVRVLCLEDSEDDPSEECTKLLTKLAEALKVLRDHHEWHLESGPIGLPDGNGGWIEIDNAAEYGDSRLCERTSLVLNALPVEFSPLPRLGSGSNHWENWQMAMRRLKAAEATLAIVESAADSFHKRMVSAEARVAELLEAMEPSGVIARTEVRDGDTIKLPVRIGYGRARAIARAAAPPLPEGEDA
ncbi:MAG: hypothetical protein ACYCZ0_00015 [Minisyncoccota bacterium]